MPFCSRLPDDKTLKIIHREEKTQMKRSLEMFLEIFRLHFLILLPRDALWNDVNRLLKVLYLSKWSEKSAQADDGWFTFDCAVQ
jgi:hypothetical protein